MEKKITFEECGFEFAHLGMNFENKEEALKAASFFELFGMKNNMGKNSTFMNKDIEIMFHQGRGKYGHIAFRTADINKAMEYFKQLGYEADPESFMYFPEGGLKLVYLKGEVGGFAVHLVQKQ